MQQPNPSMPPPTAQSWPPKASAPPVAAGPSGGGDNWSAAPIVRGKIELDAPPALPPATKAPPLALPSPEEAGVAAPRAVARVDWNAARERLSQLGGVGLQMTQNASGVYCVTFVMRTNRENVFHNIEATAATEADAVALALRQAEQWVSGK